ncbi:MAG: carbon storage regulator [Paenibacillus sp. RIFOXYA1_FULL_44_5]|nr:MAG: carbon storage regulator [Paenibacillus sp. RIFOXYA1_FULL_44_5]
MLILTRKKGQTIVLNDNIEIIVTSIEGDQVKIGINAPADVKIYRKEVLETIQASNREAVQTPLNLQQIKQMTKKNQNME